MAAMMQEIEIQMATIPPFVNLWMNWMLIVFMLSLAFIWKHKPARIVLGAFFLTMPLAMLIFYLTNNVHLFAVPHLIVWTPLLVYLVKTQVRSVNFNIKSPYGIWIILLSSTIAISLVFDVRDVILVLIGKK